MTTKRNQGPHDRFPDITPVSVVQSVFHVYELTELTTPDEVNCLLTSMYDYPEHDYYLFLREKDIYNEVLKRVTDAGWLIAAKTEFFYYRLPMGTRNFARILRHEISREEERKLVEEGPMYKRITLCLSKKAEREIAFQHTSRRSAEADTNPIEAKPGLWGLSVDLFKMWRWIKRRFMNR